MTGWSMTLDSAQEERDTLIADLWEAGTTGITEEEAWLRAFFDHDADRDELVHRFSAWNPRVESNEETDWVARSRSMWQPFAVGERFWLIPEWMEDPAPPGRLRLPMRPGMASGSGTHQATQLCLMAMEKTVKPGMSVLDVGTGSGILAEAARLLGAVRIVGCDIDHEAAAIARQNVPEGAFFTGSLRSLRPASFDLAVGNLNAATLAALGADLARVASVVVTSGFHEDEVPRVERSLGRTAKEILELDGWACLIC